MSADGWMGRTVRCRRLLLASVGERCHWPKLHESDLVPDRDAPEGEKEYEVVAKEEKNTYGDCDGYSHDEVIESVATGVCEGLDDEYRRGCIGCPGDAFDAAGLHERRTHIWSAECETQHYYDGG